MISDRVVNYIRNKQIPLMQPKRVRWRLDLSGRPTTDKEEIFTASVMIDECLGKLNQYMCLLSKQKDLTSAQNTLNELSGIIVSDMYLRRFCKQQDLSIFRYELNGLALQLIKLITQYPNIQPASVIVVFRFIVDCDTTFDLEETYLIVSSLLTYYAYNIPPKQANIVSGSLFIDVNTIIYLILTKSQQLIDCYRVANFQSVYSGVERLDCAEAAVTLLLLCSSKDGDQLSNAQLILTKNKLMIRKFSWMVRIFPQLCSNVSESIKQLTSEGRYKGDSKEEFVTKLLPLTLQLLDSLGFVAASKLFQEAYWLFNLEGVFRLLVRTEVVEMQNAIDYVQLMTDNQYLPLSAIELLAQFCLVPQLFEESNTMQLDELREYIDMLDEVECRDHRQLAHFFEKLCMKNEGFLGLMAQKIFDLKWDFLIVAVALLKRHDYSNIQLYFMKNGLVGFLIESLLKQSIATPFLRQAYDFLSLFLRNNSTGLSYVLWIRNKLEKAALKQNQEQEGLVDIASRRLCDSQEFIIAILANYLQHWSIKNMTDWTSRTLQSEFGSRLLPWFLLATTARSSTTDIKTINSLTTLRLLILVLGQRQQKEEITQTFIVCSQMQQLQLQEQEPKDTMVQQLIRDCLLWKTHMDTTMDWRKVEFLTSIPYNKLRRIINELTQNLTLSTN